MRPHEKFPPVGKEDMKSRMKGIGDRIKGVGCKCHISTLRLANDQIGADAGFERTCKSSIYI